MLTNIFDKFFAKLLLGLVVLEIASLAVYNQLIGESLMLFLLVCLVGYLTIRKTEYGLYALFLELVVGGKGYLFFWPLANQKVSLRLALFVVVFLIWLIKTWQTKNWSWLKNKYFLSLLVLGVFLLIGVGEGTFFGRPKLNIFLDVNNYLYLALIGLYLTSTIEANKIWQLFLAGTTVVALKTVITLFIFAHNYCGVGTCLFYHWLRNTGIGEITEISFPLFRIFFYSHFYNLMAVIILLALVVFNKTLSKKEFWLAGGLLWLNFLTVVISQSRSFWLAGGMTVLLFVIWLISQRKIGWRIFLLLVLAMVSFLLTADLAVRVLINDYQQSVFYSRLTSQVSADGSSARREQFLPLLTEIKKAPLFGWGLAKTITYKNSDPRIKNETNPEGWYTTYTFELAYLDIILKLGLLGLAVYLSFIFLLGKKYWQLMTNNWSAVGWLLGLVALLIIQMFTPYLNHPLGIGYLLLLVGLVKSYA
ncbi:MAG: O-antigen ligase family protein [Candidatus Buchananbacteria bacterium]